MNCRHKDFQSFALPTELSRHKCVLSMNVLAGMKGFEPLNVGSKFRCLTTWLHPIHFEITISSFFCPFFRKRKKGRKRKKKDRKRKSTSLDWERFFFSFSGCQLPCSLNRFFALYSIEGKNKTWLLLKSTSQTQF